MKHFFSPQLGEERRRRVSKRATPARLLQLASMALAVVSAGSLLWLQPTSGTAQAATEDSSVTVRWDGTGNGDLAAYQPTNRADYQEGGQFADSGKNDDFKDVEVSVSQTKELTDQVVTVNMKGLADTFQTQTRDGQAWLSSNYYQLMQCWGPDPNAADFAETCQWGAFSGTTYDSQNVSIVNSSQVEWDTVNRGLTTEVQDLNGDDDPSNDRYSGLTLLGIHYRTVQGAVNRQQCRAPVPEGKTDIEVCPYDLGQTDGLDQFFTRASSNEQIIVPSARQNAQTQFSVQSALSNPYQGCGAADDAGAPRRCWLVVVPRGEHAGSFKNAATACDAKGTYNGVHTGYGERSDYQAFSTLDPNCSYWDDRVVVPLDFQPTQAQCAAGAARQVAGTEFSVAAMASWQSALCQGQVGSIFSLSTASGSVVRDRLASGDSPLVFTAQAAAQTDGRELRYAPAMNTGLVVAFRVDAQYKGRKTQLRLTPRLVAKMLTCTYKICIPVVSGTEYNVDEDPEWDHIRSNPSGVGQDPEFQQVNQGMDVKGVSALIVLGPQGDDAIALLWQWIQADDQARAFLQGQPDEWGTKINPYFLPSSNSEAKGGGLPYDLSKDPVDVIPKADQTVVPDEETAKKRYGGQQLDQQSMSSYVESFAKIAKNVYQGATGRSNEWDLLLGKWSSTTESYFIGNGFDLSGITDATDARRQGLDVASLARPNSTDFVAPTDDALAKGIAARRADDTGTTSMDFSALGDGAYPLTQTVYAGVDVANATLAAEDRQAYAGLIDYAAGDGQVQGEQRGQLPIGYVPLTDAQRAQARDVARQLREWQPAEAAADQPAADAPALAATEPSATDSSPEQAAAPAQTAGAPASAGPEPQTSVSQNAASQQSASQAPTGTAALIATLLVAIAGLGGSLYLLRRGRTQ